MKDSDPEKNKVLEMCDIWIKDFKFDNLASTYVAQKKTQLLLKEFAKTEDVKSVIANNKDVIPLIKNAIDSILN